MGSMAKVYQSVCREYLWEAPLSQDMGWKAEWHTQSAIHFRVIVTWWKRRQWISTYNGWPCDEKTKGDHKSRDEWGLFVPPTQLGHVDLVLENLLGLKLTGLYGSYPQTIEKRWRPESAVSYSSNSQSSWSRESHLGNVAEEKSWESPWPPSVTPFSN